MLENQPSEHLLNGDQQNGNSSQMASEAKVVKGFSKFNKKEKIDYIQRHFLQDSTLPSNLFEKFWHPVPEEQKIFDEFSENTISNYYAPYGVVPNLLLNGQSYCVPMVIEESSVVAACSKAANFWLERGGVKAEVLSTTKVGQVHLSYQGPFPYLQEIFVRSELALKEEIRPLVEKMQARGGGVKKIELRDCRQHAEDYFQLFCEFETCDAMGANFINSVLEALARVLLQTFQMEKENDPRLAQCELQVIMSILSNYTPDCVVRAWVECPIEQLRQDDLGMSAQQFAQKIQKAVWISKVDRHRATTHNKGIMNGIDAVVLATGNDFRAVEACAHTYAARNGNYQGLTDVILEKDVFRFELTIPLALGTVGGLTSLHPLANASLDLLGRPNAQELMQITAAIGLLQNFAALKSLVTSGIQKGHMKMHLLNILNHFKATDEERALAKEHFSNQTVSFSAVRQYLQTIRPLH